MNAFRGLTSPSQSVTKITFPWHYFGGGFKMRIDGQEFRFSFVEPNNDVADISGGKEKGKAWKKVLLGS